MNASAIPFVSLGNIWPNLGARPHDLTNDDIRILKKYLEDRVETDRVEIIGSSNENRKRTGRGTTVSSKIDKTRNEETQAVILLGR
jgi:hypothetical protein